ncbi:putative zinc protease YmxG [Bacteroidia bacterium]|nr:putative zinc protease YmxG [Clostridia bacterium]GHV28215.1 putative zinc protease YmxG [Bacteroidia bacterium]
MTYTIEKISGIDCIFSPMQDTNSITLQIMCKAGSVYESPELSGISHFLEHNFFKGGEKYTTPKAVAEAVDRFGGEFNAGTGNATVSYYVKCAPNFAEQALDVLADMMMHAQFPEAELEREKGVVIQELKMYEDNPQALAMDKRSHRYFGENSYGRPIIGTIENIQSFTQKTLQTYKYALYTKDNLIIVIAGKIMDPEKIKKLIADYFSDLPTRKYLEKPAFPFFLPAEQSSWYEKKTEQNHLIISARGFNGNQEQRHAAKIMTTILGGNMSSRLFQNIREKQGLCYYIRAAHYTEPEYGDFLIRAGIDKERFDFGVEKIFEEIQHIAKGEITQSEFENAVGFLNGQIQMGIESSDDMANFLGSQYLEYGYIETLAEILAKTNAVTLPEVIAVCPLLQRENLYHYYVK